MKNIRVFLSETFQILEVKFSIYLNRRVFVMINILKSSANSQFLNFFWLRFFLLKANNQYEN